MSLWHCHSSPSVLPPLALLSPLCSADKSFSGKKKKEEDLLVRKKTQLINIDWNDEEFIYLCSIWNTEDI